MMVIIVSDVYTRTAQDRKIGQVIGFDGLVHGHSLCPVDTLEQPRFRIHPGRPLHQWSKRQQAHKTTVEDELAFQFTQPNHLVLYQDAVAMPLLEIVSRIGAAGIGTQIDDIGIDR